MKGRSPRWLVPRCAFALIWLLVAVATRPAAAQWSQCVDLTNSWTTTYYQQPTPVVQSITYVLTTQLLIASYTDGGTLMLVPVPVSVAQPFTTLPNADSKWNSLLRSYSKVLLAQNGCPLLAQSGNYLTASP